jgi:hypothetical protein
MRWRLLLFVALALVVFALVAFARTASRERRMLGLSSLCLEDGAEASS